MICNARALLGTVARRTGREQFCEAKEALRIAWICKGEVQNCNEKSVDFPQKIRYNQSKMSVVECRLRQAEKFHNRQNKTHICEAAPSKMWVFCLERNGIYV